MAEAKRPRQLKVPCPFCGGTELWAVYDELRIECRTCGARGPICKTVVRRLGTTGTAYQRWNRRASDPGEGRVVPFAEIPFADGVLPGEGLLVESCPFCGKEARPVPMVTSNGMTYHVECTVCHSRGRIMDKKNGSDLDRIKAAVRQWNTRKSGTQEAEQ